MTLPVYDPENPYFAPFASSARAVVMENCTDMLMYGALYCNWFGHATTLVEINSSISQRNSNANTNANANSNVSLFAVVYNGADDAVHVAGEAAVKGGVVAGYGALLADTPVC